MKSLYLRSGLALACAIGLAACGGGNDNLVLGGNVFGLTKDGLAVQNKNGPTLAIPAGSSTFAFPELISSDTDFEVIITTQPTAAKCNVVNGKGKSGGFSILSVEIHCTTNSYDLGGTVSGLDSAGLVLINGSQRVSVPAGATSFTFTTKYKADGSCDSGCIPDGSPYGITVFQQPAGRTCSVANGTGKMGSAAKNDVVVTCI
ncbi:hypothetical protein [Massilia cavernae]|uniref:Lipoprotein n=1 Tax=Massilia cavernae TaxID=2320864 RepID=A0A418Y5R3_9BURK|nr:hypothetical protein [Massilia cavernae]RJG22198.1 hypothetical protein D3872_05750 [Massilia cavernae]